MRISKQRVNLEQSKTFYMKMNTKMKLSPKYKDFLKYKALVEFLEGTTFAGKTNVRLVKFMLRVAESLQRQHIISSLDFGMIEKNIITKDLGILDVFGDLVYYNPFRRAEYRLPNKDLWSKKLYTFLATMIKYYGRKHLVIVRIYSN